MIRLPRLLLIVLVGFALTAAALRVNEAPRQSDSVEKQHPEKDERAVARASTGPRRSAAPLPVFIANAFSFTHCASSDWLQELLYLPPRQGSHSRRPAARSPPDA